MPAVNPSVARLLELGILSLEVLDFLLELLGVILEYLAVSLEALIAVVLLFCLRLEIFDLFSVLFFELILLTKKSLGRYVDYFLSVVALLLQLTDFRLGQLGLAVLLLDDGVLGGDGGFFYRGLRRDRVAQPPRRSLALLCTARFL